MIALGRQSQAWTTARVSIENLHRCLASLRSKMDQINCKSCGQPASTFSCNVNGSTGQESMTGWCAVHAPRTSTSAEELAQALAADFSSASATHPSKTVGQARLEFIVAGSPAQIADLADAVRNLQELAAVRMCRQTPEPAEDFLRFLSPWYTPLQVPQSSARLASVLLNQCATHGCRCVGHGAEVQWAQHEEE